MYILSDDQYMAGKLEQIYFQDDLLSLHLEASLLFFFRCFFFSFQPNDLYITLSDLDTLILTPTPVLEYARA